MPQRPQGQKGKRPARDGDKARAGAKVGKRANKLG
jgi:hypothetical protein